MNDDDYKQYICALCNKLIKEKYIIIDYNSKEKKIKVQIKHGELYCELNDDDKYNVEQNIKNFYVKKITSILNQESITYKSINENDDSSETNNSDFEKNKKQRT